MMFAFCGSIFIMSENVDENEVSKAAAFHISETTIEQRIRAIKNESRILHRQKDDLIKQLQELHLDLVKLKRVPLIIGYIVEPLYDSDQVIVRSSTGPQFVVNYADTIDKDNLLPNIPVALHQRYFSIIRVLPLVQDPLVRGMEVDRRPSVSYADIGGLNEQIHEAIEAIELSLTHSELFEKIGIESPKGILFFGPPGNGKTLLAKAIAAQTKATFISVNAPELVQKYIGEGARIIRELFQYAQKRVPSIIFIDEIDAIGSKRIEMSTSGDREVQRTFMQLLAELDGFKNRGNVKIIGSTNRIDTLDPALMRPGRFDRFIKIPTPDTKGRLEILQIHTRKLNMKKGLQLGPFVEMTEGFSGADLRLVCQEAGMNAIRSKRIRVREGDFFAAITKMRGKREGSRSEDSNTYL